MSIVNQDAPRAEPSIKLPAKVIVSLRAGVVLAIANVICVMIFVGAWTKVRAEPKVIQVTGSARRAIQSDLIVWRAKVSAMDPELTKSYQVVKDSTDKTVEFLKAAGIPADQIKVSSVGTLKRRARDEKGNETERIVAYELWQDIEVSSSDVQRVAKVADQVTGLIKDGIIIESNQPSYIYTRLADLKVSMLAEATRDAQTRAQQIAANSGARLGNIIDAKMGVMQINAVHNYDASGSGINDTSSFEKEITAVVSAKFGLE
jgi:uncharacterized protein